MKKYKMIKAIFLLTLVMILSSFQGDTLEYILSTRIANFEFFHIAALIIIGRLVCV